MKILFTVGKNYLPQGFGGIQRNTHDLCNMLMAAGHEPTILAGLSPGDMRFYMNSIQRRLLGRAVVADKDCGYPVFRGWDLVNGFDWLLKRLKPDCVVLQSDHMAKFANLAQSKKIKAHAYFHNTTRYDIDPDNPPVFDGVFSNSKFTHDWILTAYGYQSVIVPPIIIPDRYRVHTGGKNILFFNPHPDKGGPLVVEIAKVMPDLNFDFVASWTEDAAIATVRSAAQRVRNIHWHPATDDTREHLRSARVVLMPSQWVETWGRVASEAQVSGIPVIASNRGGLPEAVGLGGITLPYDSLRDAWCAAIRRIVDKKDEHLALSRAALAHAGRPSFQPLEIVKSFLSGLV